MRPFFFSSGAHLHHTWWSPCSSKSFLLYWLLRRFFFWGDNFPDVLYFMLGSIFRKMLEVRITDGFRYRWKIQIGLSVIFLLFQNTKKTPRDSKKALMPMPHSKSRSFFLHKRPPKTFVLPGLRHGSKVFEKKKNLTIYRPYYLFFIPQEE